MKIEFEPGSLSAQGITQMLYHVSSSEKFRLLLGLLEREGGSRVLTSVNRRTTAFDLVKGLTATGYPTRALAAPVPHDTRPQIRPDSNRGRPAALALPHGAPPSPDAEARHPDPTSPGGFSEPSAANQFPGDPSQ
mgnify:CR=1 FL=1